MTRSRTNSVLSTNRDYDHNEVLLEFIQEEVHGMPPKLLKSQSSLRWAVLIFGNLALVGCYFCYDNPTPIKSTLSAAPFNFTDVQYNSLYSVYSAPNIVLPLIGGLMMDKFGLYTFFHVFTTLCVVGQLVFSIGAMKADYTTMMGGRFIFGLGGEAIDVALCVIFSIWFRGKELSLAYGISILSVATFLNGPVIQSLAEEYGVGQALMFGFYLTVFSLVCVTITAYIDRYAEEKQGAKSDSQEDVTFQFSDLKIINTKPFWLVTAGNVILFLIFNAFIPNSTGMLQTEFGFSQSQAASIYTIPYIVTIVLAPIMGYYVDRVGRRSIFSKSNRQVLTSAFCQALQLSSCASSAS